jgi:flavin-dependent dehydrogenase
MTIAAPISDLTLATAPLPEPNELWDVVVIGAGPAGCAAAIAARGNGLSVLLVERSKLPRYKVCGCCLSPGSLVQLRRLGVRVDAAGVPLRTASIGGWGQQAELELADEVAVSRAWLDASLAQRAAAAGAVVLHPVSARLGEDAVHWRCVELRSPEASGQVRGRLVIAADGLAGATLGGVPMRKPQHVGVGATFAVDTASFEPGIVYIAVGGAGYAGAVRLADGTVNVAASLRGRRLAGADLDVVANQLFRGAGMPRLPDGLAWRGTPGLRFRPQRATRRRVIRAGDAAGFWEPFTGEGIGWALEAGSRAGDAAADLAARWSRRHARNWGRQQRRWIRRHQRRSRAVGLLADWPRIGALTLRTLCARPQLARLVMSRAHAPAVAP